jgi:hypothetical protein
MQRQGHERGSFSVMMLDDTRDSQAARCYTEIKLPQHLRFLCPTSPSLSLLYNPTRKVLFSVFILVSNSFGTGLLQRELWSIMFQVFVQDQPPSVLRYCGAVPEIQT